MSRDWTITERPAAWWQGRRINAMTAFHAVSHGEDAGKRFALVDFHCGSSRAVDLAEVEVEVVVTSEKGVAEK